ncbi:MAG: hypothetical protein FJ090_02250 [Deltaproteobacteria bacterium]|nr:hypothetical protein [Deltaproteobacteria bacterium]
MTALWLLAACGGGYDGSWLMSFIYKAEEGGGSGQRDDLIVDIYTTASGQTVANLAGTLMTGAIEAGAIEVSLVESYAYKRGNCTYESEQRLTLTGEFSGTAAVAGDLQLEYTGRDCDETETDVSGYSMTGLRLDADPARHVGSFSNYWFDDYYYYEDYGDYDDEDFGDTG